MKTVLSFALCLSIFLLAAGPINGIWCPNDPSRRCDTKDTEPTNSWAPDASTPMGIYTLDGTLVQLTSNATPPDQQPTNWAPGADTPMGQYDLEGNPIP